MRALAIGAGAEQARAIAAARALGAEVLALDGRADAEGAGAANRFTHVDLMDAEAVLAIAREFRPDFVIPVPLARPLIMAGIVNDALGLKGVTERGARLANDKQAMREAFTARGVPMARQMRVDDAGALRAAADALGFPLVLKPRAGSGSRGVTLIERESALPARLDPIPHDDWIAEAALQGTELGVDGVKIAGQVHVLCLRVKRMTEPPHRQELSYHAIDPASFALTPRITALAAACLEAMACDDCFFNADMMAGPDGGVSVIELAPRPGGNNIFSHILTRVFGTDLITWFMEAQMAGRAATPPPFGAPVYFEYLPVPAGRVARVGDLSALRGGKADIALESPLRPGDVLGPVTDGASAMARGWVLCSPADACEGAKIALDCARIIIVEAQP